MDRPRCAPRPVELLAPAGSEEALTAAVRCGADAVYLGAGRFHARQNAQNFTLDSLERICRYCHARGVAVHLTMNTLVKQSEESEAMQTVALACDAGVDALIVQDWGLASLIRRFAPAMRLHASTQTSIHTPEGVRALAELGFDRVILAREMRREEIAAACRAARDIGLEVEVFVHGAQCMSVSGQCRMSAMLGGRSANRGQCAQPCRLPFRAEGGTGYDLSLMDSLPIALRGRAVGDGGRFPEHRRANEAAGICRRRSACLPAGARWPAGGRGGDRAPEDRLFPRRADGGILRGAARPGHVRPADGGGQPCGEGNLCPPSRPLPHRAPVGRGRT